MEVWHTESGKTSSRLHMRASYLRIRISYIKISRLIHEL
uniref:Uncharacterized protein n=1 Tax=Anguilla anguilla TaxID=7936 RepID=A0A0E9WLG4_ANGAN